ncbi:MAG TPA: glucose-6-phosphate dehydrogenase [Aliidongia sp.]|nr:glucose-6-phosphate dehydrogenase [Aliidongia sp.]
MVNLRAEPFDCVVFGGTGDLALRKLLPALYHRDRDGQLPDEARIIGVSRARRSTEDFIDTVQGGLERHLAPGEFEPGVWQRFAARLRYVPIDVVESRDWSELATLLGEAPERIRVFYLATSPDLFGTICHRLHEAGVTSAESRVVLEKPIGHDLASARRINDEVASVFSEPQIFRIDHYLGKETVQNLLALRFANTLFEPLWNSNWIDHVQITVAETIGTEGRAGYYEGAGALRDMIQNHLLQLLCLIAMEPPQAVEKEAIRDEKLKVLRALGPIRAEDAAARIVRGQYRAGAVRGEAVKGYLEEAGVDPDSRTETFVCLKVDVRNWRWAGVPFYLRTGKRLPERHSEVVVYFRPVRHDIFPGGSGEMTPNRLVIQLQPDESIRLHLMAKEPGPGGIRLKEAPLNLSFAETFRQRFPDAYERLLMDVVRANGTLFMRRDEVETAWQWTEQVLNAWNEKGDRPKPYTAGSWGPSAAIALIERDGRTWHEGA